MSKQQNLHQRAAAPMTVARKPATPLSGYGLALFELMRHQRCSHDLAAPSRTSVAA